MIKDIFTSTRDNLKDKTSNPFLGAYIIVWLIRNWRLVYTLFNFDKEDKLKDKIDFVKTYYTEVNFIHNILLNILWAFAVLIITYLLLNISRLIVNLSEKRLTPWVYKITDSKSIVLKTTYEIIRLERDDLQVRLDQERESRSRLENRIKKLEEELIESYKSKDENTTTLSQVEFQDTEKQKSSETLAPDTILFKKLKDQNLLNDFLDIAVIINKGDYVNNSDSRKDSLIKLGLITFSKNNNINTALKLYKLTPDGEAVLRKASLE